MQIPDEQNVRIRINDTSLKTDLLLPEAYFTFHYDKSLSLKEKILYLILIHQAVEDGTFPVFQGKESLYQAIPKMKKKDMDFLLAALEKKMLIEFYPPAVTTARDLSFLPAFLIASPVNPEFLQKSMETLIEVHGAKEVRNAQMVLSQINREGNPETLSEVLDCMKKIGMVETQKVFYLICSLPPYHPNRNYTHIISCLSQAALSKKSTAEVKSKLRIEN